MPSERLFATCHLVTRRQELICGACFHAAALTPRHNAKRLVRCSTRARIAYARLSHSSQAPKNFAYAHAVTETRNACNNAPKHFPDLRKPRLKRRLRSITHALTHVGHSVNCRISPI